MTITEVRNAFERKYRLACAKRGASPIDFGNGEIALMISEAQQKIVNELKIIETYADISLTVQTEFTTFSMPSNYGEIKGNPTIDGAKLDIVNIDEIPKTGDIGSGKPSKIAIYYDGTGYVCAVDPTPSQTYTLRIWYYTNTLFYSPSGATSQNWGSFDGEVFSGNLKIPDKYVIVLLEHMVSQIFDDNYPKFVEELNSLRAKSGNTMSGIKYNLGGY